MFIIDAIKDCIGTNVLTRFEQIHYVLLRILFKLIKIINRFVKGAG